MRGDGLTFRGGGYELTLSGVRAVASGGRARRRTARGRPRGAVGEVGVRPVGAPVAPVFTCGAGAGMACADQGSASAAGVGRNGSADGERSVVSSRREFRSGAGALLPHAAADRTRMAQLPAVHRGRCYLDMVNNVTVLGHAHPRVADTAARQLRKLNTNSRFNYEVVVEFSERLAATLPDPLDTVFLVNSGSEASDLAIRLATAATGRRDVVAVREAYHGWTFGTDAVSTSIADNPNALATRPDWVHTVESPNSFRGKYRGAEATRYADDAVRADRGADRRRASARGVHLRKRVRQCGRDGAAGRVSAAGVRRRARGRRSGDLR